MNTKTQCCHAGRVWVKLTGHLGTTCCCMICCRCVCRLRLLLLLLACRIVHETVIWWDIDSFNGFLAFLFSPWQTVNQSCEQNIPLSRAWFRSTDLWVMGPARFHCATHEFWDGMKLMSFRPYWDMHIFRICTKICFFWAYLEVN